MADEFETLRERMVHEDLYLRDIDDERVLEAMRSVPRHLFVPREHRADAYRDGPLPIGFDQTISQPYVVASMTQHLELTSDSRVLEIGTGSGYQAAILGEIAAEVYTTEAVRELYDTSVSRLATLGYANVHVRSGDGLTAWNEKAPFDAIIVTAAAPRMPEELIEQLADGGIMVVPVASVDGMSQHLVKVTRYGSRTREKLLYEVRFVPMRGSIEDD